VLAAALERTGLSSSPAVTLSIVSEIPSGAGLKSSSAVGSAIVRAVDAAAGRSSSAEETARVSAEVSRRVGASATGAYDDALAGLSSGAVVTDNRGDRLLRTYPIPRGLGVALWIPPGAHPPSPELLARFRTNPMLAQEAVDAALEGRLWEAMDANSRLVEAAMGYPYGELRERLRQCGATASGASGLGPAFAVIGPVERLPALLEALPAGPGIRRTASFTPPFAGGAP